MAVIATATDASTDATSSSSSTASATNECSVSSNDKTRHDDEESVAIPPSPELTPEELQLVAEILNSNLTMSELQDDTEQQDDETQDDKDHHHHPIVMADQSLHDLVTNIQTEYKQWETLLEQDISALEKRRQSLTKRYETAKQETLGLLHLIQRRNQEEISSLMMRLQNVVQDELVRRESLSELESQYHSLEEVEDKRLMLKQQQHQRQQQQQQGEPEEKEVNDTLSNPLTMDDIHGQINLHDITRTISEMLGLKVLKDLHEKMGYALSDYLEDCQHVTNTKMQNLQQDILIAKQNHIRNQQDVHQCVKVGHVANWIVSVLMQLEQSEKQSDALVHAKVVYGEKWTSDTFQPKTVQLQKVQDSEEENKKEERRVVTLGDLHVQKYIPQDWERVLLPSGWKDWKVPSLLLDGEKWSVFFKSSSSTSLQNILPVYFWHSLPRQVVNIVESSSSSSSLEKTIPAPVETILDPNVHLGSCWKMVGRNGRVTFRLKRPIRGLESITIDHYPWLPSAHDPEEFWNHVSSAPRFMRVIGYPACEEEDVECREQIGFDVEHPIYMNSFEYKIDASLLLEHDGGGDLVENYKDEEGNVLPTSSSQTFQLSPVNLSPDDEDYNEEEEEEENTDTKEEIATCDADGATCQREDKQTTENLPKLIAALTLTIDVNWGHPNYTCLYRVRVNEKE